jgi:site-specific recombinase XerC
LSPLFLPADVGGSSPTALCASAIAFNRIKAMVESTDSGLIGARDRALMLLRFAGAFRRSELVGLCVEDCTFGKDGLTVTLRRSKQGRKIGIPYGSNPETCPVRTVQASRGQSR